MCSMTGSFDDHCMPKQVQESATPPIMTIERSGTPGAGRVDAVEVSRQVGARRILQELSLSIEPAELVAIAGVERARPRCWRSSRDCNRRRPAKFNTTARFAVPGPGSMPASATCPRTTSSTSRCHCAAPCATPRGYGCRRAHRRPRRTGSSSRRWTTSTWPIGPRCRYMHCRVASASAPVSPWSY